MRVRKLEGSDLERIVEIADRAWREIRKMSRAALGDKISDILNPSGDDRSKGEQIRAAAAAAPETIFVCEEDGEIIGFITFSMDAERGIAEIGNNAADPECGVKGVGQAMYRAVLAHFKANGMKVACVVTGLDDAHARARRAYERAGFEKNLQSVKYFMDLDEYPQVQEEEP